MSIEWYCLASSQLSLSQLYAALALRCQVFVVEQQCAYLEADGLDLEPDSYHVLAYLEQQLIAYARILHTDSAPIAIGRVVVQAAYRGQGLGDTLMCQLMQQINQRWPDKPLYLSAQAHLQQFYAKFGFSTVSDVYLEDGIPHVRMQCQP